MRPCRPSPAKASGYPLRQEHHEEDKGDAHEKKIGGDVLARDVDEVRHQQRAEEWSDHRPGAAYCSIRHRTFVDNGRSCAKENKTA